MKYTRFVPAATLALLLASCGQNAAELPTQATAPQSAGSPASQAEGEVIAGAYLVGFKQGLSAQSLQEQAALQAQAIREAGGELTSQWVDISAAAAQLSEEALARLQANPMVEYVEPDLKRVALGKRSAGPVAAGLSAQAYAPSGEYTWGDNALQVPTLRSSGYTGAGVAVCIGDTGIDGNHPEFQRKIKGYRNFTGDLNRDDPYKLNDVSHHGTHVAGTVFAQYGAGTGASGLQDGMDPAGVGGVAPGINLYIARVLGDSGSGSSSGIINGVNWCAAQLKSQGGTESKVVISLSLGGGRASRTEQRAYTSVWQKGAFTVAATGNDGAAVSYPAAYDNVVGIGAIDNNEQKADFSNFGTQVDLVGPGVAVLSSVPLGQGSAVNVTVAGASLSDEQPADKTGRGSVSGTFVAAGGANNEFCGTSTRNSALNGNIALIARGTCSFEEKTANAVASGAKAVVIYNNAAGALGISLTNSYSVPVVGITQADGQSLMSRLPVSGTVAVTGADYEYFDGTSMATPHVSAAAAVVWAAKPSLTNSQLLTQLTSTAKDLGPAGRDNDFGSGLVQPLKAITGK